MAEVQYLRGTRDGGVDVTDYIILRDHGVVVAV
jgi:hypothetical protein